MPRPKRYEGISVKSFYYPVELKSLIEKAEKLAKTERITFSELVWKALQEYVERHFPGNPQVTIPSVVEWQPRAPLYELKLVMESLERKLKSLKRSSEEYRLDWLIEAQKAFVKAVRLNDIVKDRKVDERLKEIAKEIGLA